MQAEGIHICMTLGDRVRAERDRRNWSQNELAIRSGVSQPNIGRIENGKTPNPGVDRVRAIADAYGMTMDALLSGVELADAGKIDAKPRTSSDRLESLEALVEELRLELAAEAKRSADRDSLLDRKIAALQRRRTQRRAAS